MAAVNPQLALLSMKGQTLQRARAELARCKAEIEKCTEVVEKAMESDEAIAAEILSSVQAEVDRLRQQEEELVQDIAERAAALRAAQVSALSSAGAAGRQPPPHSPSTAGAEVAGDGVVSPVAAGGGANTHPPVGAAPVIGGVPVGALAQVAVASRFDPS